MMALYIVLLGVFLAIILLCVLLSVHMAIEVEAIMMISDELLTCKNRELCYNHK